MLPTPTPSLSFTGFASCTRLLLLFSLLAGGVLGVPVHTIQVGLIGTSFEPSVVPVAATGDVVRFVFTTAFHSVVQSSEDAPCTPLQGGFNSGVVNLTSTALPRTVLTWDLTVVDDTQPIWFFCEVLRPEPHCNSGMVGVINPPSNPPAVASTLSPTTINVAFRSFEAAASTATLTPSPVPTVLTSGIGAVASGPPSTSGVDASATLTSPPETTTTRLSSSLSSSSSSLSTTNVEAAQTTSLTPSSSGASGPIRAGAHALLTYVVAVVLVFCASIP
jgi:hypothetical protein